MIFIDTTFGPRNFYLYLSILCQNSIFPNSDGETLTRNFCIELSYSLRALVVLVLRYNLERLLVSVTAPLSQDEITITVTLSVSRAPEGLLVYITETL